MNISQFHYKMLIFQVCKLQFLPFSKLHKWQWNTNCSEGQSTVTVDNITLVKNHKVQLTWFNTEQQLLQYYCQINMQTFLDCQGDCQFGKREKLGNQRLVTKTCRSCKNATVSRQNLETQFLMASLEQHNQQLEVLEAELNKGIAELDIKLTVNKLTF